MNVSDINIREAKTFATITRADGTVEELGLIDYFSSDEAEMAAWELQKQQKDSAHAVVEK
jgi:hypothetical protein